MTLSRPFLGVILRAWAMRQPDIRPLDGGGMRAVVEIKPDI
jgi:hypothetical protein